MKLILEYLNYNKFLNSKKLLKFKFPLSNFFHYFSYPKKSPKNPQKLKMV